MYFILCTGSLAVIFLRKFFRKSKQLIFIPEIRSGRSAYQIIPDSPYEACCQNFFQLSSVIRLPAGYFSPLASVYSFFFLPTYKHICLSRGWRWAPACYFPADLIACSERKIKTNIFTRIYTYTHTNMFTYRNWVCNFVEIQFHSHLIAHFE